MCRELRWRVVGLGLLHELLVPVVEELVALRLLDAGRPIVLLGPRRAFLFDYELMGVGHLRHRVGFALALWLGVEIEGLLLGCGAVIHLSQKARFTYVGHVRHVLLHRPQHLHVVLTTPVDHGGLVLHEVRTGGCS